RNYGYTREEFLGMTIAAIRPPGQAPRSIGFHPDKSSAEEIVDTRQHRKKDGSIIDVEVFAHDIDFADGKTILVVVNDITERTRAERRIRELATLLNKASEAIVVTNLAGGVTFWNHGAEHIFGWTSAEATGGL